MTSEHTRHVWPLVDGVPLLSAGDQVHLVGIGGAGMSGLARVLAARGLMVSGSDRSPTAAVEALRNAGIVVSVGHDRSHVPPGCTLVVRSPAVPDGNPELIAARDAGIPITKRAPLLGALMDAGLGVAVAGTHGKTTTSGLLAYALTLAGLDPTYFVGGEVLDLGTNASAGGGPHVVVEADEYDRSFHHGHPEFAVVTSIELDHPDIYPNLVDVIESFTVFASRVRSGGRIIANGQSAAVAQALRDVPARVEYYAVGEPPANLDVRWRASRVASDTEHQVIEVTRDGAPFGRYEFRLPGEHNVGNALAVVAAADALGVADDAVREALRTYRGAARRFQVAGRAMGVTVIDDYAHHPTEIEATLAAARERFPESRLWAIVEPHTYSRVAALAPHYAPALSAADAVLVTPIYAAREQPLPGVTAAAIASGVPGAVLAADLADAAATAALGSLSGDVLLFMGAGDITEASRDCLSQLRQRAVAQLESRADAIGLGGDRPTEKDLAGYTSLRVGGPADLVVRVGDKADLAGWFTLAAEMGVPCRVIGRGSNLLAADGGVPGLVIVNRCEGWTVEDLGDGTAVVVADSGVSLAALGGALARAGWAGIEAGIGIPGSVGAGVVTNAGAHGWSMADSVVSCEVLLADGQREERGRDDLEFEYRRSALSGRTDALALSVRLAVHADEPDLIAGRIAAYASQRRATQPREASAGSMFKNPSGDFAGRLIEACGLKGHTIGGAQISQTHANFFVNLGGATAADVNALVRLARSRVREQFGVELELEIERIGVPDAR
ncbi:MAG: UDP-N-acetylmuramate--L-alanine ligase [Anaerolineae bacterium]